ncbi:MAG TPA: beta-glucosidase [Thermoanaerobaculia bacterium]|nr:beta-glucosidase [Thermoanaerobaculia bacterium]
MGGFECSTHVRRDGRRLDLIASTRHDRFAREDYARLAGAGLLAARDGVRWHLVDRGTGRYDWKPVRPLMAGAREAGVTVAWDLLHFGWPDGLDPFTEEFVERFAAFAHGFAAMWTREGEGPLVVTPVNEISFLAFAGGEKGFFNPFARRRGDELKEQLVRAAIAACREIRAVVRDARFVHSDPIINIIADPTRPEDRLKAEMYRLSQYAAWDMIAGRARPELGGRPEFLDIVGADYYVHNQWIHRGKMLPPSHPQHLPLRYMLRELSERYRRPIIVAETGIEAEARPDWLRYVGREALAARALGVALEAVCLYPIVDHPGWEDDRHCPNGLWGYPDEKGRRPIDEPFFEELVRQERALAKGTRAPRRPAAGEELLPQEVAALDRAAWTIDEKTDQSREQARARGRQ